MARRLHVEPLEERWCASSYSVIDLAVSPSFSAAIAINAFGQVVGSNTTATTEDPFLWTPTTAGGTSGSMIDLGILGGTSHVDVAARGINGNGQVVGDTFTASAQEHAFLWTPTTPNGTTELSMIDLGTLGGAFSDAFGINNATSSHGVQVVGAADTAGGQRHAFLWTQGGTDGVATNPQMKDLGALGGTGSSANGINDASQVAGEANLSGDTINHAFLWQNGVMTDLGSLNGNKFGSGAFGLNGLSQVVGASGINASGEHAVLWQNGKITDLGALGTGQCDPEISEAFAINASTQVVGQTTIGCAFSPNGFHAFLWQKNKMTDLNTLIPSGSGWTLEAALGINDAGRIVGYGLINNQQHAYLLVPTTGPLTAASTTLSATTSTGLTSPAMATPTSGGSGTGVGLPSPGPAWPLFPPITISPDPVNDTGSSAHGSGASPARTPQIGMSPFSPMSVREEKQTAPRFPRPSTGKLTSEALDRVFADLAGHGLPATLIETLVLGRTG